MKRLPQLVLHYLGLRDHPEPWTGPVGKFYLSDKGATVEYLSTCGRFSEQTVRLLTPILGSTMTAKMNGRYFMVANDYVEEITHHRTTRRGRDWLVTEFYSAVYARMRTSKLLRDPDATAYWVASERPLRGYRERFREITEAEFYARATQVEFDNSGFPISTPPSEEILALSSTLR